MTNAQQGAAFVADAQSLPLERIRRCSGVLAAWLDECGEILWHSVRVDRSTLEGVWEESDGLVRAEADLHVVPVDGAAQSIRIVLGGLQHLGVMTIRIHAPARTSVPFLAWPLTDETRALLADPGEIEARFVHGDRFLSSVVDAVSAVRTSGVLLGSTSSFVERLATLVHGYERIRRIKAIRLAADPRTVGHTACPCHGEDGGSRWTVPALATVTFEDDDGQPGHADVPVIVSLVCEDGTAAVTLVDLPAPHAVGTYAPA